MDSNLENDSKLQCKNALRQILNEFSDDYSVLEKLLILSDAYDDPIMTFILDKISKVFFNYLYVLIYMYRYIFLTYQTICNNGHYIVFY